jgi:hypothetical protein
MNLNQTQQYAIKLNGNIVSKFASQFEAQSALMALKVNDPLYENANITVVADNNKELLLG